MSVANTVSAAEAAWHDWIDSIHDSLTPYIVTTHSVFECTHRVLASSAEEAESMIQDSDCFYQKHLGEVPIKTEKFFGSDSQAGAYLKTQGYF